MPVKLVSWNINSVRARLDLVAHLIDTVAPDILCLQEIKADNPAFPAAFFSERGYVHQAVRGQKNHHGVATVSRVPFTADTHINWCGKGDARHVAITLAGGVDVHNFYVPAGGDEPDPVVNDKFAHKLDFLAEMRTWSAALDRPSVLVGDLNVAPLEEDVWNHRQLLKVVSHTPIECEAFSALQAAHGWVDVVRRDIPVPQKLYSWWSYRARDWQASDRGRRLDHILASPALAGQLKRPVVLKETRGWSKPSDHAAMAVELEL